jgi:hypothetical protein
MHRMHLWHDKHALDESAGGGSFLFMSNVVRAHGQVQVQCSPEQAFSLLADPTQVPSWRPDVLASSPLEGQGVGARYVETIQFFGRKSQTFEVVEHGPARRLVVRAVDGLALRPTQSFTLERADGGTRITYEIELPVSGWFVVMKPLLARMIPSKWAEYVVNLQQKLEGLPRRDDGPRTRGS